MLDLFDGSVNWQSEFILTKKCLRLMISVTIHHVIQHVKIRFYYTRQVKGEGIQQITTLF